MLDIKIIPVGPFEVNCFIITSSDNAALIIDPGSDAANIAAEIKERHLSVVGYYLTHGHMDHVSALARLHREFPADIHIHPDDADWAFTEVNQMLPYYPTPQSPESLNSDLTEFYQSPHPQFNMQVIHTPGHTPGSVCLFFPDDHIMVTGDTLFAGSAGRTDFPGGSAGKLAESLKRLRQYDDNITIYPGHGTSTTLGHEKRNNVFMK